MSNAFAHAVISPSACQEDGRVIFNLDFGLVIDRTSFDDVLATFDDACAKFSGCFSSCLGTGAGWSFPDDTNLFILRRKLNDASNELMGTARLRPVREFSRGDKTFLEVSIRQRLGKPVCV
jgi:hypothetical protein